MADRLSGRERDIFRAVNELGRRTFGNKDQGDVANFVRGVSEWAVIGGAIAGDESVVSIGRDVHREARRAERRAEQYDRRESSPYVESELRGALDRDNPNYHSPQGTLVRLTADFREQIARDNVTFASPLEERAYYMNMAQGFEQALRANGIPDLDEHYVASNGNSYPLRLIVETQFQDYPPVVREALDGVDRGYQQGASAGRAYQQGGVSASPASYSASEPAATAGRAAQNEPRFTREQIDRDLASFEFGDTRDAELTAVRAGHAEWEQGFDNNFFGGIMRFFSRLMGGEPQTESQYIQEQFASMSAAELERVAELNPDNVLLQSSQYLEAVAAAGAQPPAAAQSAAGATVQPEVAVEPTTPQTQPEQAVAGEITQYEAAVAGNLHSLVTGSGVRSEALNSELQDVYDVFNQYDVTTAEGRAAAEAELGELANEMNQYSPEKAEAIRNALNNDSPAVG